MCPNIRQLRIYIIFLPDIPAILLAITMQLFTATIIYPMETSQFLFFTYHICSIPIISFRIEKVLSISHLGLYLDDSLLLFVSITGIACVFLNM